MSDTPDTPAPLGDHFATEGVRYCHDVFCVRPEHPATEPHSDPVGRRYLDGYRDRAEVDHNG